MTATPVQPSANNCNCSQSLSAASAYDARQNRLYFINLFGSELQYIDLNQRELKIYHVQNQKVKQFVSQAGEADNITRMTFGSDGYGYALTNNGNHLIRFSTGKNISITDLGSLTDGKVMATLVCIRKRQAGGAIWWQMMAATCIYLQQVRMYLKSIQQIELLTT